MQILPCQQLSIDNEWSLARLNACHIGNQNEEMGVISSDIIHIKGDIQLIQIFQGINLTIWGAIGIAFLALVVKKIWGK